MNSIEPRIKTSNNRNLNKRQRVAKRARFAALQLELVHPRLDNPSEIGTAPPDLIQIAANPLEAIGGVAPILNPRSRTQVLAKLVSSLTTIEDRDETILRLRKRLFEADIQVRIQRKEINSWKHRAANFQRRVQELLCIVPPQQPTNSNASPVASPEPLNRPNFSGRITTANLCPSANHSVCHRLPLPDPRPRSWREPSI